MATEPAAEVLNRAAEITHPLGLAAAGLAFAFLLILSAGHVAGTRKKRWPVFAVGLTIVVVSSIPAILQGVAWIRGVYHLRVIALGPDHLPRPGARMTSSVGGEPKQVSGGWEFDIPVQTMPPGGTVSILASVDSEFLSGAVTTSLSDSYYPSVTIQLAKDTSATIAGIVVDRRGRAVTGATVSIVGQEQISVTNKSGYFNLQAHAAVGQPANIHAEKGNAATTISEPAGSSSLQIMLPLD